MITKHSIPRRTFLKTTAVAGGMLAIGEFSPLWAGENMEKSPSWIDRPTALGAANAGRKRPRKIRSEFLAGLLPPHAVRCGLPKRGGCVAYYPTKIPFHHRSQWLGESDVFGDLVAGCRKLGMVVVARTDPHATYDDACQAHPEWIAVGADGKKRPHWASPEMWVTCALGPYNFEFMTEVKKEIMSRYKVDGIFINRWDGSGTCYCDHCRELFKADTGRDLRATTCGIRHTAITYSGDRNGSSKFGICGMPRSGK